MMEEIELLPCPFCGGAAHFYETENDGEYCAQVQCFGCGAEIGFWLPWTADDAERDKAMAEVTYRWNARAEKPR